MQKQRSFIQNSIYELTFDSEILSEVMEGLCAVFVGVESVGCFFFIEVKEEVFFFKIFLNDLYGLGLVLAL